MVAPLPPSRRLSAMKPETPLRGQSRAACGESRTGSSEGPRRGNASGLPDHHDVHVQDESSGWAAGGSPRAWTGLPGSMSLPARTRTRRARWGPGSRLTGPRGRCLAATRSCAGSGEVGLVRDGPGAGFHPLAIAIRSNSQRLSGARSSCSMPASHRMAGRGRPAVAARSAT